MGGDRITSKNHCVLTVDTEKNLLVVKGAVPGPAGGYCIVRTAKKA
jgi:large subunit ribosomal protein L3